MINIVRSWIYFTVYDQLVLSDPKRHAQVKHVEFVFCLDFIFRVGGGGIHIS